MTARPTFNWPRIRSYVLRGDGRVVFSLTCSHSRVANLHDEQKAPEWFLGKRWPCDVPDCDGTEHDVPEPPEDTAA